MNEARGAFLRVGLLVLGGLALVIGLVWFFGGSTLSHGTLFETYFGESVQGLEVGAPVKYRGVTVGRVTDLGLVAAEYGTRAAPAQVDRDRPTGWCSCASSWIANASGRCRTRRPR